MRYNSPIKTLGYIIISIIFALALSAIPQLSWAQAPTFNYGHPDGIVSPTDKSTVYYHRVHSNWPAPDIADPGEVIYDVDSFSDVELWDGVTALNSLGLSEASKWDFTGLKSLWVDNGKVMVDPRTIAEYAAAKKNCPGIKVVRVR